MSKKAAGHHKQVAEYLKHAAYHHEELPSITRLDATKQPLIMLTSRWAT
jgi:hypothetical protein